MALVAGWLDGPGMALAVAKLGMALVAVDGLGGRLGLDGPGVVLVTWTSAFVL